MSDKPARGALNLMLTADEWDAMIEAWANEHPTEPKYADAVIVTVLEEATDDSTR